MQFQEITGSKESEKFEEYQRILFNVLEYESDSDTNYRRSTQKSQNKPRKEERGTRNPRNYSDSSHHSNAVISNEHKTLYWLAGYESLLLLPFHNSQCKERKGDSV